MAERHRRVGVVIPAGGKGLRLGGRVPKQFLPIHGKPVLLHTLLVFEASPQVDEVVIVAAREQIRRVRKLVRNSLLTKVSSVVPGGKERQDSVWNGMLAFSSPPDIVLVHDAVRPLLRGSMIKEVVRVCIKSSAAVVAVRVKDTIKTERVKGFFARTMERSKLWAVQTPQCFQTDLLMKAHRAARQTGFLGTDEASLVERLGVPVRIVEGDYRNIKITTRDDLALAGMWLKR